MKKILFICFLIPALPLQAGEIFTGDGSIISETAVKLNNSPSAYVQKSSDSGIIYLTNGMSVKAGSIVINKMNVEFTDETGRKQYYGRNMVMKIVYKDGSVITPDLFPDETRTDAVYGKNLFIDLECGWNGYTGSGLRIDYRLFDGISINGGAGEGFWGYRFSGSLRYYFSYPYGSAFSIGAAHNTGDKSFKYKEETVNGSGVVISEEVSYVLKPVTAINAALSHFWQVNGNNRFYVEAGYSYAIQKTKYTYSTKSGNVLTKESKDAQDLMSPGGIIITIGYSFAI